MTDFYARLEEQLVAAGRRRQEQGRVARAVAGRGRVLVAATAVAAVLVAVVAFALPGARTGAPQQEPAAPAAPAPPAAPDARLARIRVAVYNGTAETGMGRRVGAKLRAHGAHVDVFGSVLGPPGGLTVVRYTSKAEAQARRVATVLGTTRIEPYDAVADHTNPPPRARTAVIVLAGYDADASP